MSLFRSIHTRYEKEEDLQVGVVRPWPAIYRQSLPNIAMSDYALQVRIENQHAKSMDRKQLAALPSFTESRRMTSKAGWTYYGQWRGVTFQTLLNLFSTPQLYPWVRLESFNGEHSILDRQSLANYRIIAESDGAPLTPFYGGPLMVHCFDYYVEYSIPYLKSIVLMQGDHPYTHPNEALGFTLDKARVEHGRYYDLHHERMTTL